MFVKAVLLLSLLTRAPLDQVFTTTVCGGCVSYRYRTVYHVPPFSTQHTPSFCVSPSSCQHFSRLVNDSRLCNGTAKASTFFTRRQLLSLDPGAKPCRLDPVIFSCLKDLGIARNFPRKEIEERRKEETTEDSRPYYLPRRVLVCRLPCGRHHADSHPSPCSRPQLVG